MADRIIDLDELRQLGDDLETFAGALHNQRLLNRLGLGGVRLIRQHARAGLDKDGKSMGDYSPAYARLKERANVPADKVTLEYGVRRLKAQRDGGLPIDAAPVRANLYDSMLHHLRALVADDLDSVEIGFDREDKEELMGYHIDAGRDVMGFSPAELDRLQQLVEDDVARILSLNLAD